MEQARGCIAERTGDTMSGSIRATISKRNVYSCDAAGGLSDSNSKVGEEFGSRTYKLQKQDCSIVYMDYEGATGKFSLSDEFHTLGKISWRVPRVVTGILRIWKHSDHRRSEAKRAKLLILEITVPNQVTKRVQGIAHDAWAGPRLAFLNSSIHYRVLICP
eukprot:6206145-Pleurochrysis_carterae.AAC.4